MTLDSINEVSKGGIALAFSTTSGKQYAGKRYAIPAYLYGLRVNKMKSSGAVKTIRLNPFINRATFQL